MAQGAAIGDVLGLAAGVAVSPLPIVAIILLLVGPADLSDDGQPAAWTGWLKVLLGVLLLLLAARQWRGRPAAGAEPEMPKWMAGLDRLRPGQALALGALLSAANPKNGGLTIAAAASIAGAGLAGGQDPGQLEDLGRRPQRGRHGRAVPGLRAQAARRRHRRAVLSGRVRGAGAGGRA